MHYWDYTNGNRICSRVFYLFFHDKIFSQTHDIFIFIETGARGFFGSKFLKIKWYKLWKLSVVFATQIYSEGMVSNDPIELFCFVHKKNETVSQENLLFRGNPSEGLPRPPYSYHCKDAIFVLMLGGMELKNIKVFSKLYYKNIFHWTKILFSLP